MAWRFPTKMQIQFCIEEWKSGQFKPEDLDVKKQAEAFDAHMTGLEIYGDGAAIRLDHFQREWYKFGM